MRIYSGKEIYENKLKTYAGTLAWNQSLTQEFYKSNLASTRFIEESKLNMSSIDIFDEKAVEDRTKLLFNMVKLILVPPNREVHFN